MDKFFLIAVLLALVFLTTTTTAKNASAPANKDNKSKGAPLAVTNSTNSTNSTSNSKSSNSTTAQSSNSTASSSKSSMLKFGQCPGAPKNISMLHHVEIKDCKGSVCTFKRGEKYFIRVEFTPSQRINDLELNITGIIAKKGVPFAVESKRLCLDNVKEMKNETKCSIKRNVKHHFEYSMDVLNTYPSISLQVAFHVKYGNKNVFCFMFPVKLI